MPETNCDVCLTDETVAFVTEARGQYNLVHNYWQPQVTAGLRINLDQLVKTTSSR